jgi:phosphonate transport system substrate-binding protein
MLMHFTRLLMVLLAALALSGCGNSAPEEAVLRFSAIPDQKDATKFELKFGKVAEHLSKKLGVPVEYVHATSYDDSVDLFRKGEIQLAWFGGLTGVQAMKAVPGARAIAQGASDPQFKSYFIANAETGLTKSEDFPDGIAGRRFSFGSMRSTSGRLMPEYFIRQHNGGRDPKDWFEAIFFSGAHDKTCELVQAGTWEVGAVNFKTYDRLVAAGKIDPEICRVIWTTPTYTDYNFTAHPDLETKFGKGFTDRLQGAITAIDDPQLLAAFERAALIPARNEDFDALRDLAAELGFLD